MDKDEMDRAINALFSGYGSYTRASEFLGVNYRTMMRWLKGENPVPDYVAEALRAAAHGAVLPPVKPKRPKMSCDVAIADALEVFMLACESAGWSRDEVVEAIR